MTISFCLRAAAALTSLAALRGGALAQAGWTPGSEVVGQPMQVTTNGVTNTVYLDAGGSARMISAGGRTVPGSWTAMGGQLCLNNGAAQECWPYASPFRAGAPVTLTSSCNATSTWLAEATNTPPPAERGERGK
jgi:hypothetical protein